MKKRYYIIPLLACTMGLASCDLIGDIDSIKPEYKLTDENIITDKGSAEALLREVYRNWRNTQIDLRAQLSCMSGALDLKGIIESGIPFSQNNLFASDNTLYVHYGSLYRVVNYANIVIDRLEANAEITDLTAERKSEMIAECRFHRAMAHFYLLRMFGEFHKPDSRYGIVLGKTRYVKGNQARASVADSYTFILEDLEFAGKHAPEKPDKHYYISRTTAKALEAKVRLYRGDYAGAEQVAEEVINSAQAAGYRLEVEKEDKNGFYHLYTNSYESSEVLFALYTFGGSNEYLSSTMNYQSTLYSPYTESVAKKLSPFSGAKKELRFAMTYTDEGKDIGGEGVGGEGGGMKPDTPGGEETETYPNHKYPYGMGNTGVKGDTYYFMRLAEVYFIYAEAAVRNQTSEATIKARLMEALERWKYTTDKINQQVSANGLLETIRLQKWMEFMAENGEEWYDLIRYYSAGNLTMAQLTAIKSTLTNESQFIMPIPRDAIAGNNLLEQNP